jgi:GDP-mannose 6-dehydrogenase
MPLDRWLRAMFTNIIPGKVRRRLTIISWSSCLGGNTELGVIVRIAIFGLGYVGCASAACFAGAGHEVVGVDVNPLKVDMINAGESPIIEKHVAELIKKAVQAGRLRATSAPIDAVSATDISLICVGTPSRENGGLELRHIKKVSQQIGRALVNRKNYHVVAVRSTVLPGTIETKVIPILAETSGRELGVDFGVCSNPEFLREGSAVDDFNNPPLTLIGEFDARSGEQLARLYQFIDTPTIRTDIKTAEMVKYVGNAFHALKISFANEIGNLCKILGVDSHKVMDIFCLDTKLNVSSAYLKPGYAFGGSCLPKDMRALLHRARHEDLDLPLLQAVMSSNKRQAQRGVEMVLKTGKRRVGVLGLSFKAGTDDLRESPMVYLVETLLGKGYDLKIYDPNVSLARLMGANKQYIEQTIPHISSLLRPSLEEVLEHAQVLVVGQHLPVLTDIVSRANKHFIIDLIRLTEELDSFDNHYDGICW